MARRHERSRQREYKGLPLWIPPVLDDDDRHLEIGPGFLVTSRISYKEKWKFGIVLSDRNCYDEYTETYIKVYKVLAEDGRIVESSEGFQSAFPPAHCEQS